MSNTREMTDAERLEAAGGHPVGNCDDCGDFHIPWSVIFHDDGSEKEPPWIRKERELIVQYANRISAAYATAKPPFFSDSEEEENSGNEPKERLRNVRGTLEVLLSYIERE